MSSRRYQTRTAGCCCPAALVARWGRLLPGLLLLLALAARAMAQSGVDISPDSVDFGSRMLSGMGTMGGNGPTITCPSNVGVTAGAGQTKATVGIGTATGAADGVMVAGTRGDGKGLADPYPVGVTTVTWTATDRSANTAICV